MRGCLFTIVAAALVAALAVWVGLPAVADGVLTAGVQAAGLQAKDLTVNVSSDPPWGLLGLHADRVRVRATSATFRGMRIGALDVALLDVALVDRTAGGVAGRLSGVTVPDVAGQPLGLGSIDLGGGGSTITATTTVAAADARALVAAEVATVTGIPISPSWVRLSAPNKVVIAASVPVTATLSADQAGNLVADAPGLPTVTLIRAGVDVPLRFTAVRVDGAGNVVLAGDLAAGLLG